MPIPVLLAVAAIAAGAAGIGSGAYGVYKMKDAKDTFELAEGRQKRATEKLKMESKKTTRKMDAIGKYELEILNDFKEFSDLFEKIQSRPVFKKINFKNVELPEFRAEEIPNVSIAAHALLNGLGSAAAGTAGGFAAAGATTSVVMSIGTASTGTAISTLSGAAATNAALAALGGGSIAAGGGGIALGTALLTGASAGVAVLFAGVIFSVSGKKMSDKADNAYHLACETEEKVDEICKYFNRLNYYGNKFRRSLKSVKDQYDIRLEKMKALIGNKSSVNWNDFSDDEKLLIENEVLLVGLLYKMCNTKLIKLNADNSKEENEVNVKDINDIIKDANNAIDELKAADLKKKNEPKGDNK